MAYEPKDGDVSIFKNENRTNDNQPTHRGTMQWNGEKLKISLWPKATTDGKAFLSGKVQVDDYVKQQPVPASAVDDFIEPASSEPQLPPSDPIPSAPQSDDLPF